MTMDLGRRIHELRLALMLLTRLPVGRLREPVPALSDAQWAYPLVGIVIGSICFSIVRVCMTLGLAPILVAALTLGASALLTGALHHDGLADFADGVGGGRDREHALEIMRDSRIGTYGALALIFAVILSVGALAHIAEGLTLVQVLLVAVVSRLAMLVALLALPPARGDGLGHTASAEPTFAPLVPGSAVAGLLIIATGLTGLVVAAAMALVLGVIAVIARRRLGGQTGDVLGAVQLVSEVTGWITLSSSPFG
jgi:adenosylcobinamide-GDP ribazoletransferase